MTVSEQIGEQDQADITVAVGEDGVAVLTIDVPGERMNILRAGFYDAAHAAIDEVLANNAVKAAVIISGKADSFIAGADIKMIQAMATAEEAAEKARVGHGIMNKIASSRKPFVAAIHGVALGGGCELALACHGRIVTDDAKTALGLPEVQLGVLPGFGGSQRLPRLIGIANALDMMVTGKHVRAKKAKRMGLVDDVVPNSILLTVAAKKALSLVAGRSAKKTSFKEYLSVQGMQRLLLEKNAFGRKILFDQARKKIIAKTKGNYPAPEKIIDVVQYGIERDIEVALENELQGFGYLAVTPESKQLIGIYFSHTELKKETFVADPAIQAKPVSNIGVLGGGLMGGGIAAVSLDKADAAVRVKDIRDDGIRGVFKHIYDYYQARIKRRIISRPDAKRKLNSLTGSLDYAGFSEADLIIEAVFEDAGLKRQMVSDIEGLGDKDIVFATNTSSIPIKDIARGAKRPENIIGMHYFSPVEKMPLLEIIKHTKTADQTIATCVKFGKQQGKTVIVVKDVPGFYVNRVLFPYLNEAGHLAMEGVPLEDIDKAFVRWGMPVGPFKLMDEVGIDVGIKVQHILEEAYGERMQASEMLDLLVDAKRLGKKVKYGFYDYTGKSKGKQIDESVYQVLKVAPNKKMSAEDIVHRCMLPLLNECALCLEKKVISNARDGDIGAVFGIGFPAFRGGPFRYIDSLGAAVVVEKLQAYQASLGERFSPAPSLLKLAESKKSYY